MEDKKLLIEVNNVSMRFKLPNQKINNLKEMFVKLVKRKLKYRDFYAVKDISLKLTLKTHTS